ncbi:MAG: hypothetical protein IPL59_22420 [Candidatus Competibacteraceae bacterium]|nr:hypothetical protein [Candidatus Competibacteraceae bacterium]
MAQNIQDSAFRGGVQRIAVGIRVSGYFFTFSKSSCKRVVTTPAEAFPAIRAPANRTASLEAFFIQSTYLKVSGIRKNRIAKIIGNFYAFIIFTLFFNSFSQITLVKINRSVKILTTFWA